MSFLHSLVQGAAGKDRASLSFLTEESKNTEAVSLHRASSFVSPLQEAVVRLPVGEARPAHHHVLQQAEVGHLVLAARVVEQHRRLHLIGLYASHVVRLLKRQDKKRGRLLLGRLCHSAVHL